MRWVLSFDVNWDQVIRENSPDSIFVTNLINLKKTFFLLVVVVSLVFIVMRTVKVE